ncbi:dual specificity protein phosphatase 10-like isoform X2 [Stegodyphus dumicola]|uniref:dual specificity protein phosphatase 10-like isoform X2 n=1 Tax=Stegodyphus dumicola TaxID=202533 RepID=UPI0015B0A103|nr:dual specificity protein phosphatase 10-like isoform X2 [Stegodyphus dumicola]
MSSFPTSRMSGGVDVQLPGDPILSEHHGRRRPQILYLPSRSTNRRRQVKDHVKLVSPSELDSALKQGSPLVLDCRPAFAFGKGHVAGAVSVRCSDRISRRRLQHGRLGLCDLISDQTAKERLETCRGSEVVLYDDGTSEAEQLTEDHPLSPVISSIREMGARPVLLRGGWQEFSRNQQSSCSSPPTPEEEECPPSTFAIESPRATAILPFLYVGNERDAEDLSGLKELGIGYVLNVTNHVPGYCDDKGFAFLRLPAIDSYQQNIKQYFNKAFAFIDEARQRNSAVLVHCQAGVSRSATIVIGYLMYHTSMSSMEAYQMVKSKRPIISPNLHFMGQLLELEQILQNNQDCSIS